MATIQLCALIRILIALLVQVLCGPAVCRPAKSHSLGVRLTHFDAVSLMNLVVKYYFIWNLTHFVLCDQYTFYIAHMETEVKSHSF